MRKLLLINLISATFLFAGENVVAQSSKVGSFNIEYVINLMPGVGDVDTLLTIYERDFLTLQYNSLLKEFTYYDSLLRIEGCTIGRRSIKEKAERHLKVINLLQNWQQYSQQQMHSKQ